MDGSSVLARAHSRSSNWSDVNPVGTACGSEIQVLDQERGVSSNQLDQMPTRPGVGWAAAIRFQETAGGLDMAPLPRQRKAEILGSVVPVGIDRGGRPGVDLGARAPPEEVQVVAPRTVE